MHKKRAFTLIELLVVVVIISLLTLVAIASYLVAQRSSRDNARKATLASVATALENFRLQSSRYPGVTEPSTTLYSGRTIETWLSGGSQSFCIKDNTYYFHPSGSCSLATRNTILDSEVNQTLQRHNRSSYRPEPTWIPEIGGLISVSAYERKYLDSTGGTTGTASFMNTTGDANPGMPIVTGSNGNLSSINRTMSYRRIDRATGQGYALYTVLENANNPQDAVFTLKR
jgi:prepilin-type N-terminal cleavage/methylation domain-containing protein